MMSNLAVGIGITSFAIIIGMLTLVILDSEDDHD